MNMSKTPSSEDFEITYTGGIPGPGPHTVTWLDNRTLEIISSDWMTSPSSVDIALLASQANFVSATGKLVDPFEVTGLSI